MPQFYNRTKCFDMNLDTSFACLLKPVSCFRIPMQTDILLKTCWNPDVCALICIKSFVSVMESRVGNVFRMKFCLQSFSLDGIAFETLIFMKYAV